jgi:DNA-binding XRE family transcriptional regulator
MTRTEYIFSLRENIATNVQHYRYKLGMNQTVFSEYLGMSEHVVYLLENPHKGGTTLNTLATIAHVLGTTVADLVSAHEGRTRLRGRAAQQRPRRLQA